MKKALKLIAWIGFFLFGAMILLIGWQFIFSDGSHEAGHRLIDEAVAVEQIPDNPLNRILILGDSLWAGVGADNPDGTLAGRLTADHPSTLVVNEATHSATIIDGFSQLNEAKQKYDDPFDLVIIQLGANDVLTLKDKSETRQRLEDLLAQASEISDAVLYIDTGNVGDIPFFVLPFDWFYTWQSRRYSEAFQAAAESASVRYLNLYDAYKGEVALDNPDLYAADGFHPNSQAYGIWYDIISSEITNLLN